jgi:hypothetical protein
MPSMAKEMYNDALIDIIPPNAIISDVVTIKVSVQPRVYLSLILTFLLS